MRKHGGSLGHAHDDQRYHGVADFRDNSDDPAGDMGRLDSLQRQLQSLRDKERELTREIATIPTHTRDGSGPYLNQQDLRPHQRAPDGEGQNLYVAPQGSRSESSLNYNTPIIGRSQVRTDQRQVEFVSSHSRHNIDSGIQIDDYASDHTGGIRQVGPNRMSYNHPDFQSCRTVPVNPNWRPIPTTNDSPSYKTHKKPPIYDGHSSLQDYLVQFEIIAEMNQWSDTAKAMELVTSLRGLAQSILSDLSPAQRKDYPYLVTALTARFEPTNQSELYRAQMKTRLRKKGETIQELAQDIKRTVRMAYPGASMEVREQLCRDCFVDALNDKEIQWSIYQQSPKTMDESVHLAVKLEAFHASTQRNSVPPRGLRMQHEEREQDMYQISDRGRNTSRPEIADIVDRLAKMEVRVSSQTKAPTNQTQSSYGNKSRGKCHFCGKEGHWQKDCHQKNKYRGQGQNRYQGQNK
ncbi:MAG: C2HC-type zinc finger protein, partial [Sedimenticola sp.]